MAFGEDHAALADVVRRSGAVARALGAPASVKNLCALLLGPKADLSLEARASLLAELEDRTVLKPLLQATLRDLKAELAQPERAPDDWAIDVALRCACQLCKTLGRFLSDAKVQALDWPLESSSRMHVHQKLDAFILPVTHETLRRGRPYTLQLRKTSKLHSAEKARRQRLKEFLETLQG